MNELIPSENIPRLTNLLDKKKELEKDLNIIEEQLSEFKKLAMEKLKSIGVDSVKTQGFNFIINKRKRKIVDVAWAKDDIVENQKLNLNDFMIFNTEAYIMQFPDSPAIREDQGSEYMSIRRA